MSDRSAFADKNESPLELAKGILQIAGNERRIEVELAREVVRLSALVTESEVKAERPCTCHPDDSPPIPCQHRYALSECRAAALALCPRERGQVRLMALGRLWRFRYGFSPSWFWAGKGFNNRWSDGCLSLHLCKRKIEIDWRTV